MATDKLNEIGQQLLDGVTEASRIYSLGELDITDELTINTIGKVCVIAGILATICFLCALAYNYIYHGLKNLFNPDEAGPFPDYMQIARGLTFIGMISIYPVIAIALTGTIELFNRMSSPIYSNNERLAELAGTYTEMVKLSYDEFELEALKSAKEGKTGDDNDQQAAEYLLNHGSDSNPGQSSAPSEEINSSEGSTLSKISRMLDPFTWISLAVQAFFHLCFGLVRIVMTQIAAIIFKLLIITGPLAFAFSILPVFQKQAALWFGTVVNTGFVFTTLNILDILSLGMFEYIFNTGAKGDSLMPTEVCLFDIVMLIVYVSAFWLTSKYVGKGDAGRVLSKMVAVGTAAAALMTGGSSVIGGSNLTNMIGTGANATQQK